MILKAFTESGIHAALTVLSVFPTSAGGAHGLTFGFAGLVSWRVDI